MGLIITSFFVVALIGFWTVMKHVRQLWASGDQMSAWLTAGAGVFTIVFLLGLCLALLIEIVVLGSG
jgi:hypothetical protein